MIAFEGEAEPLPRMAERVEGAGLDERLDGALVEGARIDPPAEVVEVGERAPRLRGPRRCARRSPRPTLRTAESPKMITPEAVSGRSVRCGPPDGGEVRGRGVHVRHSHLDAEGAALGEVDGRLVLVALHRREQGGQVLDGVVRLQPGRLVGDEAVAVGVGLVEGVVGERLDDVEQLLAERLVVALLRRTPR